MPAVLWTSTVLCLAVAWVASVKAAYHLGRAHQAEQVVDFIDDHPQPVHRAS